MKFNAHTLVGFSTLPESGRRQSPPSSSRAFHRPTYTQTADPVAGPPHAPTQPWQTAACLRLYGPTCPGHLPSLPSCHGHLAPRGTLPGSCTRGCRHNLPPFTAERRPAAWTGHIPFIHSSPDGQLGCFYFAGDYK